MEAVTLQKPRARKRSVKLDAISNAWKKGYFCAVAMLLVSEGGTTPNMRELFKAGGDVSAADESDQETFREFGLMP